MRRMKAFLRDILWSILWLNPPYNYTSSDIALAVDLVIQSSYSVCLHFTAIVTIFIDFFATPVVFDSYNINAFTLRHYGSCRVTLTDCNLLGYSQRSPWGLRVEYVLFTAMLSSNASLKLSQTVSIGPHWKSALWNGGGGGGKVGLMVGQGAWDARCWEGWEM